MVGGGSVHFTGNYWRFHEIDFTEGSRTGPVPGAALDDWPITYAELEPYYTKAEWELGVSGQAGLNPKEPPRSRPYPLPPLPIKSLGVIAERAALKLGWTAAPSPMAILSQPYRGRAACVHCGFCESFGCEMRAKSSSLVTVIPAAVRTGRCEIRPQSYVRKIETDRRGRVIGAVYFDTGGREHLQRARAVVVCANGAETPRLLLMSKSNRFPDGLANSSGLVGRHLMYNGGAFRVDDSSTRSTETPASTSRASSRTSTSWTPRSASWAAAGSTPDSISPRSPSRSTGFRRTHRAGAPDTNGPCAGTTLGPCTLWRTRRRFPSRPTA